MAWKKTETGIVHFVSTEAGLWTEIVSQETPWSREQLLALADFGGVYLNDSRILEDRKIEAQSYLRLHTNPRRFPRLTLLNRIAYDEEDLLIIKKPAGLPCHPTVDNLKENVWQDLQTQLGKKIFTTHRLDVPTSGLLVLTQSAEAQVEFQNLLKEKKIQKLYRALVKSPGPPLGLLEHHMEKTRYAPKTVHDQPRSKTQICQLEIVDKDTKDKVTELAINLITGRTHQIRAQLAFEGFPIIGDRLYGLGERDFEDPIALTCVGLEFPWRGRVLSVEAPTEFGPVLQNRRAHSLVKNGSLK
jgi:23S rRNA pseudouridine1911/1915/1917 synthase